MRKKKVFPSPCSYQWTIAPLRGVGSLVPIPSPMFGIFLVWDYKGLMYIVPTTANLYVKLPCCVKKIILTGSQLPPLTLQKFCCLFQLPFSLKNRGCYIGIQSKSEYSVVFYSYTLTSCVTFNLV